MQIEIPSYILILKCGMIFKKVKNILYSFHHVRKIQIFIKNFGQLKKYVIANHIQIFCAILLMKWQINVAKYIHTWRLIFWHRFLYR